MCLGGKRVEIGVQVTFKTPFSTSLEKSGMTEFAHRLLKEISLTV